MINMSNASIPKERQTAYQRWEMSPITSSEVSSEEKNDKERPTSDQSQNSDELAKQEAVALGLQAGYADGVQQAKVEMLADKENLLRLASNFSKSLDKAESEFSMEILRLSLDLAKAMIKTHLQLNSKAILSVVKEISSHLPQDINQVRLKLHSEDAKTVRKFLLEDLSNQDWSILEDDGIIRGGCIIETSIKHIDASIEKRWERICNALGQDDDWISSLR
jgi:flagellar assembly protein FliH